MFLSRLNQMNKEESEYKRLKSLFNDVDTVQSELADNLIREAAFMKSELELLKKQMRELGAVQVNKSGKQKQTECAKYYTKLVFSYEGFIKQREIIPGKTRPAAPSMFDEFMKENGDELPT